MMKRRPTAYDRDQHKLICGLVGVSNKASASGSTAYEAVVSLQRRLVELGILLDRYEDRTHLCVVITEELE
jgi:hypothetical protein